MQQLCSPESFLYICGQKGIKMRKYVFHIFIKLVLLSFIGCDRHPLNEKLVAIDSLVAVELYDSAYRQTNKIEERLIIDEEQNAHYRLLRFQTSYLTNSALPPDSFLDKAIQYYQSSHNGAKLADCYYYKACKLMMENGIDQSVLLLKKAEEQAYKGNASQNFKICEALSIVNRLCGNYRLSLEYGKRALEYAEKEYRKDRVAYSYYQIGLAHYYMEEKDSALLYFDKTAPYIKYIREEDRPYFLNNLSLVYIDEHPQKAKELLTESLSLKELVGALEQLAEIYYDEGNQDEAYRLWTKALTINSLTPKDNILHNLLEHDIEHGRTDRVCERVNEIMAIKDSVINRLKNDTIKDLQTRFDHEVAMNAANQKLIRWQQYLGVSAVLFLIMAVVWIRKRSKDAETIRQRELHIHQLMLQLEEKRVQMLTAENLIAQLEKQKEDDCQKVNELSEEIESLKTQKKNAQKDSQELSRKIEAWAGTEAWKVREGALLMEEVKENGCIRHWSNEKHEALVAYYCALHPEVAEKIRHKSRPLSLKEALYLILADMGKSRDDISAILGVDKNTLRSYKLRINKKD